MPSNVPLVLNESSSGATWAIGRAEPLGTRPGISASLCHGAPRYSKLHLAFGRCVGDQAAIAPTLQWAKVTRSRRQQRNPQKTSARNSSLTNS